MEYIFIILLVILIFIVFTFGREIINSIDVEIRNEKDPEYKAFLVKEDYGEQLKKGDVAVFTKTEKVEVGDIVTLTLPGYSLIWEVTGINEDKVSLTNGKEELTNFPINHILGKLISVER